jgi:hypothetical protein
MYKKKNEIEGDYFTLILSLSPVGPPVNRPALVPLILTTTSDLFLFEKT